MKEDSDKILEEIRIVRKLLVHISAEISSLKPFIAAAGKPHDMTLKEVIELMDSESQKLKNQLSEFDVED